MHYQRLRNGVPMDLPPKVRVSGTPEVRFLAKVNKNSGVIGARSELGECWTWAACIQRGGYALFGIKAGESVTAHRFGYELWIGPIPEGLELDHLCRVRHCVRPDHLDPVTGKINQERSPVSPAGINGRKTKCIRNHELSGDNLFVDSQGKRQCRICMRIRKHLWREARKRAGKPVTLLRVASEP
jgi:hypothetical protein